MKDVRGVQVEQENIFVGLWPFLQEDDNRPIAVPSFYVPALCGYLANCDAEKRVETQL